MIIRAINLDYLAYDNYLSTFNGFLCGGNLEDMSYDQFLRNIRNTYNYENAIKFGLFETYLCSVESSPIKFKNSPEYRYELV